MRSNMSRSFNVWTCFRLGAFALGCSLCLMFLPESVRISPASMEMEAPARLTERRDPIGARASTNGWTSNFNFQVKVG